MSMLRPKLQVDTVNGDTLYYSIKNALLTDVILLRETAWDCPLRYSRKSWCLEYYNRVKGIWEVYIDSKDITSVMRIY